MASVSEVRATFTAVIDKFRKGIKDVRSSLSEIGQGAEKSVKDANKSFGSFDKTLIDIKKSLDKAGKGSEKTFRELDKIIEECTKELKETGTIGPESMKKLEKAVENAGLELGDMRKTADQAEKDLDELGSTGSKAFNELEDEIDDVQDELRDLNNASLDGLIDDADRAERSFDEIEQEVDDVQDEIRDLNKIGLDELNRDADQAEKAFNDLEYEVEDVQDEVEDLNKVGLDELARDADKAEDEIDDIGDASERSARKGDTAFTRFRKTLLGVASAYIGFKAIQSVVRSGINMIKGSVDGAIDRLDTMKNFPKVMERVGFSAEQSEKSIAKLSDGIDGLPTTLDDVTGTAQRLAIMTKDLDGAVDTTLALNNAFLASGSNSADASRGLEQYVQMLSSGTVDLQSWRTLQETMGLALNDVAESFGYTGASAQNDFYKALKDGKVTFDDFNGRMIEMSNKTGGFADIARESSGGIRTAMTNVRTAVTRGVANVIKAFDDFLGTTSFGSIEGVFNRVKGVISDFFNYVSSNLPSIIEKFRGFYDRVSGWIKDLMPTIQTFKQIFIDLIPTFQRVGEFIGIALSGILKVLPPIIKNVIEIASVIIGWKGFIPVLTGIVSGLVAYKAIVLAMKTPMLVQTALTKGLALATRLWNMALAMNPIGIVVALLVGLGVALYMAYQKSETFRNIVNGVWKSLKEGFGAVIEWFTTTIPVWIENIKNFFSGLWSWAKDFFSKWGIEIIAIIAPFLGIPLLIWKHWDKIKEFLSNVWRSVVNAVMPIINGFINMVTSGFKNFVKNTQGIINPIKNFFVNTWNNIKLLVLGIIGVFLNLITGNFKGLAISLLGIVTAIKRQFLNVVTTIKDLGIGIFVLFVKVVTSTLNGFKTFFSNLWSGIKNTGINLITALKNGAINLVLALVRGAINSFNSMRSGLINAVNAIRSGVVNGFNNARSAVISTITGMISSVLNGINRIKGFFTGMKTSVISTVKSINLTQIGRNIIQGLINGITGMIGKVVSTVSGLASKVTGKITDMLKIKSPSRVFRDFGGFIGEGLAIGIDKSTKLVDKASQALAESAMIDPEAVGIGSLANDSLSDDLPDDNNGSGGGGAGVTTNYQAPLMQVENLHVNDQDDAREVSNGLYRLQQDHDRARGRKTS